MKSHLRALKIGFLLLVVLMVVGIVGAQHGLSLSLAPAKASDPTEVEVAKNFAYLKSIELKDPTKVLGESTTPSQEAKAIKVLYYHGISQEDNEKDISFSEFKDQMYKLKENGFQTINTQQLEEFLLHGKELPNRSFLLTFDDGRKDSYYPVDPVLKALNYRAVMFLIASEIKDRDMYYLTRNEIQDMLGTGRWEIQAHTHNLHRDEVIGSNGEKGHALTNKIWLADKNRLESNDEYRSRIYSDLFLSKQDLEKNFSVPIKDMAYPFGDYGQLETNYPNSRVVIDEIVRELYRFSYFQPWDDEIKSNFPRVDTKLIKRIGVEDGWSSEDLLEIMIEGEEKVLPYIESFTDSSSWNSTWGDSMIATGSMVLKSRADTTGASTVLKGSDSWQDFEASVSASLSEHSESFSILARISEPESYSECVFTKLGIYYKEKTAGKSILLDEKLFDTPRDLEEVTTFTMRMDRSRVSCGVDDTDLLDSFVSTKPADVSQFGLSIWGKKKGASEAVIKKIIISKPNEN